MTPELKEAYSLFFSEKGQTLLEHWRRKFGFMHATTVVANDPITTAFNEASVSCGVSSRGRSRRP